MPSTTRRTPLWLATGLLAAVGMSVATVAAGASAASAPSTGAGLLNAVPAAPSVTSDNVKLIAGIPETDAISMEFALTGPFAYVSSLDTISVLDLTDPKDPQLRGTLVNALFENEAMTYGERVIDGELVRFVIAAVGGAQSSPDDPTHVNVFSGDEVVIVDVTDPDNPTIRSRTPLGDTPGAITTSTHTVQCVDQADCQYAYSAGNGSEFSILDFTDLDAPVQLKTVPSPAAAPGDGSEGQGFSSGAGHYWDFDGVLGWHTGSGGAAAFDVSDPKNPVVVNATNEKGRGAPINDFVLHNSMRPNAEAFEAGAPPSVENGNVLLVTEEDYFDEGDELVCSEAGSFQTWYVPDLDGEAYRAENPDGATPDLGTVAPLDTSNVPTEFGGGATTPVGGLCSAHWFDYHQDGFVAQGFYNAGLRIIDVRDPANIKQFGFSTGGATEVWDAYWVPQRDSEGVAIPGQKTNIVYTADFVRGIEVFEVDLSSAGTPEPSPSGSPSASPSSSPSASPSASPTGSPSPSPSASPSGSPSPSPSGSPSPSPSPSDGTDGGQVQARAIDDSCPEGQVPDSGRTDADGNTHEAAIDCIIWWEISNGTSATSYQPAKAVNREQMASFVARLIENSGGELPDNAPDAFTDEATPVHEENIDKLAAVGIVEGKGDGTYAPYDTVTRAQMAKFLVNGYEFVSDQNMSSSRDYFDDDNTSVHEEDINKAAAAGLTNGRNGGYDPLADVLRDQMASFLARDLDLLVEEGTTSPKQ